MDFDRWHAVFVANTEAARDAGLRLTQMWRDSASPNDVWFLFDVADVDRARAFLNDPASAEAGTAAGVLDGEFHFLDVLPLG